MQVLCILIGTTIAIWNAFPDFKNNQLFTLGAWVAYLLVAILLSTAVHLGRVLRDYGNTANAASVTPLQRQLGEKTAAVQRRDQMVSERDAAIEETQLRGSSMKAVPSAQAPDLKMEGKKGARERSGLPGSTAPKGSTATILDQVPGLMFPQLRMFSLADRTIHVPWATHISAIDTQSEIYLHWLSSQGPSHLTEWVLTPFARPLWSDLWYLWLVNSEQKGIIVRLARFMSDRKINIVKIESNTTLEGKYHASRIALDCARYDVSNQDGKPIQRQANSDAKLDQLKKELILEFIKEIQFYDHSFPCVSLRRNQALWRLDGEFPTNSSAERLIIKDGSVEIPTGDLDRIKNRSPLVGAEQAPSPQALVTFEAESDILRLTVFFRNHGIVPFAVSFSDWPGAVAALTEVLSGQSFNILASTGRSMGKERMFMWMLLQYPELKSDQELTVNIRDAVRYSQALKQFNLQTVDVVSL